MEILQQGGVPGAVNIIGPAISFCVVCGDCYDDGICDFRVGLGAVGVSEGRSCLGRAVAGCLEVTTQAERLSRSS